MTNESAGSAAGNWTDAHFGEQGGQLTYGDYLRLSGLLEAQVPESSPPAHDELLFITIHQVYELWFKLILHELGDARDRLLAGETYLPRVRLERCLAIQRVLVSQVDVIDTMTPQDFLRFRNKLAPASGFQSGQFREIEFLSGLKDPTYLKRFRGLTDLERERLERRLAEPSVWEAFLAMLDRHGFAVAGPEERFASLVAISRDREQYGPLWDLAEAMIAHDQAWSLWRARHVLMAERQIGTKAGTGGSAGGAYLRSRVELRFYPELWELRSGL
ncbi:tryptophan 2,3-dioxygenase [Dactylosporangium matsuzakiense]|uniref:Tryptophan 2,3-dioxygenase n=1 Tax=Dactylosporangium matsuzakiense TaxID=53360 RepID=A0A9W6NLE3_9ACTN|nr:tryptophan 2,3-dioxygenase family protein [Dactylosporangium matsuzakiense]UWZ44095.1 tryptophan 2,3-dioxygenase [Dactylosporangium matsuzakiense]GLL00792.1 tryptophan 2,3-dioxygenase [Dactylosporangium matsuzakiense]